MFYPINVLPLPWNDIPYPWNLIIAYSILIIECIAYLALIIFVFTILKGFGASETRNLKRSIASTEQLFSTGWKDFVPKNRPNLFCDVLKGN